MLPSTRISCFFLLCFSVNFYSTSGQCLVDRWYALRNKATEHALDATSNYVEFTFYTGFNTQLWRFECEGTPGVWNIINKNNIWYALDVNANNQVIFNNRDLTSPTQLWTLNSDGTLWNIGALGFLGLSGTDELGTVLVSNVTDVSSAIKLILERQ